MQISNIFRVSAIFGGVISAAPAWAHSGHLGEAGHGHTHWLALAAVFGAAAVAVIAWRLKAARSSARRPVTGTGGES